MARNCAPWACLLLLGGASGGWAADGAALYTQHCAMCHQATGLGLPGVFPPLAKSDFLKLSRTKAIQAPCEGLSGKITVNGHDYDSAMPMVVLDDAALSAVLTHVFTHWGNAEPAVTAEEVQQARAGTKFPTYATLLAANAFAPLPAAPAGWKLAEAGALQFSPVRMAHRPGDATVLVLAADGHLWNFSPTTGQATHVLSPTDYLQVKLGSPATYGIGWDHENHFYLTSNQREEFTVPNQNLCTVWRTAPVPVGASLDHLPTPAAWFQTTYPYGIGPFNHGISHVAQGPDGMMYVSSGSRTDGGEAGDDERFSQAGEVPMTACLWKLDPQAQHPALTLYAPGLRNPYSFAWTAAGQHYALVNGPNADLPEEFDHLRPGQHYGFPYQFGSTDAKPYPWTPAPPPGLAFTHPVQNLGPDALGYDQAAPASTFTPHSSPAGLLWLESDVYPPPYRHSFFCVRYGNLLEKPTDSGFDLLHIQLQPSPTGGVETATIHTLLHPLARPLDLIEYQPGHLLIAEYSRGVNYLAGIGQPGRILSFQVVK